MAFPRSEKKKKNPFGDQYFRLQSRSCVKMAQGMHPQAQAGREVAGTERPLGMARDLPS